MFGSTDSPRRLVLGVSVATAVVVISFWSLVLSIAASADGGEVSGAWALGVALVPFGFLAAAFGSGHDRAAGAVVWALVISLGVGGVLLLVDPATALIGAYAAGATVTVREGPHISMSRRVWFALGASIISALLIRYVTPLGLAVAPGLPFTAPLLADRTGWQPTETVTDE